jgi:tetratricopeptide (TPR) repeat protein
MAALPRRILLLVLAGLAITFSLSYRMGRVVPEDFIDANRETGIDPSGWQKLDSHDWVKLAEQAESAGNLPQAQDYALRALSVDLTNGQASSKLISIFSSQGKQAEAAAWAELSGRLWTAQSYPHIHLAAYWNQQGKPDKMLDEWNILLTRDPGLGAGLFPHMQALAIAPATMDLFDKFASSPASWWPAFFNSLVRDKQTPANVLAHFHQLRRQARLPLAEADTTAYVNRLIAEKNWAVAHDVWLSGLPAEEKKFNTDLIYDGGFEGERHNTGFDWSFTSNRQIKIEPDMTFGMEGRRALHLAFNTTQHINFQQLSQQLVLPPENYVLALRFRADNYRTAKGLQWRLYCQEDKQLLAESPPLRESTPWTSLNVAFKVPAENCPVQLLRLEASSPYAHEQVFSGDLWFDAVTIKKTSSGE